MNDISDILRELFDRYGNTSELSEEFQRMLADDGQMMDEYKEWCEVQGYKVSHGYQDYIEELVEMQDSIWDNYKEYGNDF